MGPMLTDVQMTSVDIIRIPQSGAPLEIITVPSTLDFFLKPARSENTNTLEKRLMFIPDLDFFREWDMHANKYRELVDLGNMELDQPLKERLRLFGPYFLYRFPKSIASLTMKPNRHFEDVNGEQEVYGNAFIFKVKGPVEGDREAILEDVNEADIGSTFKGKGISDAESLRWLSKQ